MRDLALHLSTQHNAHSGGLLNTLWANWKARRSVAALEALDDHLLRDIGVTRAQVQSAAGASLHENAAAALQDFARANRGGVERSHGWSRGADHGSFSAVRGN